MLFLLYVLGSNFGCSYYNRFGLSGTYVQTYSGSTYTYCVFAVFDNITSGFKVNCGGKFVIEDMFGNLDFWISESSTDVYTFVADGVYKVYRVA